MRWHKKYQLESFIELNPVSKANAQKFVALGGWLIKMPIDSKVIAKLWKYAGLEIY